MDIIEVLNTRLGNARHVKSCGQVDSSSLDGIQWRSGSSLMNMHLS